LHSIAWFLPHLPEALMRIELQTPMVVEEKQKTIRNITALWSKIKCAKKSEREITGGVGCT